MECADHVASHIQDGGFHLLHVPLGNAVVFPLAVMVLNFFLELLAEGVVAIEKLLNQGILLLFNGLDFMVAAPQVVWRAIKPIRRVRMNFFWHIVELCRQSGHGNSVPREAVEI